MEIISKWACLLKKFCPSKKVEGFKSGQSVSRHCLTHLNVMSNITPHTVNFGSEMVKAKHVSGKNIFCSMNKEKIRGERIFETVHCPFGGK